MIQKYCSEICDSQDARVIEQISALKRQKFAVFAGAGISVKSGLPLQNEIKTYIVSILCQNSERLETLFQQRAQYWSTNLNKVMLERLLHMCENRVPRITELIIPSFLEGQPTKYHYLLAKLMLDGTVPTIFTTNFDILIEKAITHISNQSRPPYVSVVIDESSLSDDRSCPSLVKLHGSAETPSSVILTLDRVGKGLESWKSAKLTDTATQLPFLFLGYSDRDKDITPVICELQNEWLWFFYDGIPLEQHLTENDELDQILSKPRRRVVYANAEPILDLLVQLPAEILCELDKSDNKVGDWRDFVLAAFQEVTLTNKAILLGDILRELICEPADASVAYEVATSTATNIDERTLARLKAASVPAECWMNTEAEELLTHIEHDIASGEVSTAVKASYFRLRAAVEHQRSNDYMEAAVSDNLEAERLCRELGDVVGEAWALHNRGVVLHMHSKHEEALPLLEDAIEIFRDRGELERLAQALSSYGSLLHALNEHDKELQAFRDAISLYKMLGNEHWVARIKISLAQSFLEKNDFTNSNDLLSDAIPTLERVGDNHWHAIALRVKDKTAKAKEASIKNKH